MLLPSIFRDDLFDDDFMDFPPMRGFNKENTLMKTDAKETENGYELAMDLPGFKKEDVKMQLKEGSAINITGRYDEDTWTDQSTGEPRSQPVIILDDIEFAGSRPKTEKKSDEPGSAAPAGRDAPPAGKNFAGYESFGGGSFFDEG